MNRKITYFSGLLVVALLFGSCGSHRKNPIAKTFHNTAAHFNYHYNGELKYKEGINTINANYRIPPEGYVPALVIQNEEEAKANSPIFEEAQKKAEVGLFKHPNAKCKDDFRFLIGRAWFYRKNYILAQQNFEYILKEFPDTKLKPEVLLWLVKTHFANDNPISANEILTNELKDTKLSKKQKGELALIKAQMHLEDKNYEETTKILQDNIALIKGKNNRARVHFLLGQLYADQAKFSKSLEHYQYVSRMNTDYEFVFNAKLRIARLYVDNQEGADETQRIYKMLKKMLRDEKNVDFKDQIYYEMALLDLKKNDKEQAIVDLKKSILNNTSNLRQKALSYYKIGQIYFYDQKDYINAQVYFDSASTTINKDAPEYPEISTISKTLKEYVTALHTIEYQDSMVWLASLDSMGRERQINKIIELEKKRKSEADQKAFEEMNALNDPNLFNNNNNNQGPVSSWPFDSPDQVNQGRIDFQRIWAQRKNEDNWNRRNKALTATVDEDVTDTKIDSGLVLKYGADRAKYYKDIPMTPNEVQKRNDQIAAAMFSLGQIYHSKLSQTDSAIVVYKRLISRYPDNEYSDKAQYALFKIYQKDDPYLADEYKNKICKKDPASIYCRLCKNEDVQSDLNESLKEYQSAYDALYTQYSAGEYETSVNFSNFVLEKYFSHEKISQVYYIKGLSFGKLGQRDSMRKVFVFIKSNFPDDEVTPVVRRTLELMDQNGSSDKPKGKPPVIGDDGPGGDENNYEGFASELKAGEQYHVAILIDKSVISSPQLQILINNYNSVSQGSEGLTTTVYLYQPSQQHLAYVAKFEDAQKALQYVEGLKLYPDLKALMKNPNDKIVFISPENFVTAYGKKRFHDYIPYFEKILLKSLNGN